MSYTRPHEDRLGTNGATGRVLGWTGTGVADYIDPSGGGTYEAHGNTGSTETFDAASAAWHSATLDANCTFSFTGAVSGAVANITLELLQDGTGSRTVSWPGSVIWKGGSPPTLSTAPGAVDIVTFFSRDGGSTWYGFA